MLKEVFCPYCGSRSAASIIEKTEDGFVLRLWCESCRQHPQIAIKTELSADSREYTLKWMEVQQVVEEAQKQIEKIVQEICKKVEEDLSPTLNSLKQHLDFTYVIEPRLGDGDILSCAPCLIIEASPAVFRIVQDVIIFLHPDICSDSRLTIERKPPTLLP